MKMAVAHFQCAAWAFHTLPDLYPQVDTGAGQCICCLGGLGGPQWGPMQISLPYVSLRNRNTYKG